MKTKADRLFIWIQELLRLIDNVRDRKTRELVRSRVYSALRKRGLTANFLTDMRAVIAILLDWFFADNAAKGYDPNFSWLTRLVLLAALFAAFVTDALDGPTAREENEAPMRRSKDGVHWDPLVDKIFTLPILAYYWFAYSWWPRSIIAVTIAGDAAATMIRRYSAKRQIEIPSNKFGRAKMAILCLAIVLMVLLGPAGGNVVSSFLCVSLAFGIISVSLHARSLTSKVTAQKAAEAITAGVQK